MRILGGQARELQQLRAAAAELNRANESLKTFAYVASHDLQEPLRMIANFAEVLFQALERENVAQQLTPESAALVKASQKYIHAGVQQMEALTADLLRFSRAGHQIDYELLDLRQIVDAVCVTLAPRIASTEAKVQVVRDALFYGSRTEMRQVFQNLISNALKFHSEDATPHIRIEAHLADDGTHAAFTVSDNGIGIATKYQGRVFDPFFKLHNRQRYTGTGIGLAICRKIVESHGGTVAVESPGEGRGTTFTFTLPAKPASMQEPTDT